MIREPPDYYQWYDDRFIPPPVNMDNVDFGLFRTPKSVYEFLDSNMQGCEDYKRKMSVMIWSSINRNIRNHALIIGESGTGKTELFRVLKKAYPNTVIFDTSSCSPKSYKGTSTLTDAFINIDPTKPFFICFDEFDKCLAKGNNGDLGFQLQNECLKLLEADGPIFVGDEKNRKIISDISNSNLFFAGAFSALKKDRKSCIGFGASATTSKDSPITKDDVIENGVLTNEFVGRLNGGIIQLPPMTNERALRMLEDPRYSPAERLAKEYGISISLSHDKAVELANGTERYGMRQIYSTLNEIISESLFEAPNASTIHI